MKINEMSCFKCGKKSLIIKDEKIKCSNENCLEEQKKKRFITNANKTMNFGKFKSEKIINIVKNDRNYIEYILKKNINSDNEFAKNKMMSIKYVLDNYETYKDFI